MIEFIVLPAIVLSFKPNKSQNALFPYKNSQEDLIPPQADTIAMPISARLF